MAKPYLLVVTGRPGAGKTTFSRALAKRAYLPVISRDEIKEGYVHTFGKRHSELPEETNGIASNLFFEIVERLLEGNVSLIAEAAFQQKVWGPRLEALKEKANIVLLICRATDDQTAMERFILRGLEDPRREYFHGDKGVDMARRGAPIQPGPYVEPKLDAPTYYVDTTGEYAPSIDWLIEEIFGKTK